MSLINKLIVLVPLILTKMVDGEKHFPIFCKLLEAKINKRAQKRKKQPKDDQSQLESKSMMKVCSGKKGGKS